MVRLIVAVAHAALLTSAGVLAAVDCEHNVNIRSAANAKELRESCTVVTGDIIIDPDVSETINLDGLEEIWGDFRFWGCGASGGSDCEVPDTFNVTSSTLREISKGLDFDSVLGLQSIVFPKLNTVFEFVGLDALHNVTYLDFTNLEKVGGFRLDTANLETLRLNGLKGFSPGQGYSLHVVNSGKLESLDNLFGSYVELDSGEDWGTGGLEIEASQIPNVRSLTFGWKYLPKLKISGNNLTLTLGGPNTTEQRLDYLELGTGVQGLRRGSAVENLTVDFFTMDEQEGMKNLVLPFNQTSEVLLYDNLDLETLELPEEAEGWRNMSFTISYSSALNLTEYKDDRKIWHWPKQLFKLDLMTNLTNEFL